MEEAYAEVGYGEVTYAVRKTNLDGFDLEEGDIIGITGKKIVSKGSDINEVAIDVVNSIADDEKSVITLYYGEGIEKEQAEQLQEALQEKYDEYDVELYNGGQHHYHYIISVE